MPRIRTNRTRPPPEGYEDIACVCCDRIDAIVSIDCITHTHTLDLVSIIDRDVLEDYAKKMRDAENDPHEGKRKVESVWCVGFLFCRCSRHAHVDVFPQAHHADITCSVAVHLRLVLQTRSHQQRAL